VSLPNTTSPFFSVTVLSPVKKKIVGTVPDG
jgi:hypothetical protein